MSNFTPRLSCPAKSNKYYIKTTYGGYNKAIAINRKTGYVLPNCCGLVHGRWLECAGLTDPVKDNLCRGDASSYWRYTKDGYARGQDPRLGAIACYSGHVATVEQINADGSIVLSNSSYNGREFFTAEVPAPYKYKSMPLLGFIYNPYVPELDKELKEGTKVMICGPGNSRANGKGHSATSRHYKRTILKVLEGQPYPYRVGNPGGATTGFYKADALQIL